MRALINLVAIAAIATAAPLTAAVAQPGYWRPYDSYGPDPCREAKHEAAERGAVTGGLLGAIGGALLGGRHHAVGGAVLGGAVGAAAGSQVARSNVRCMDYPYGYHRHPDCRWIDDRGHAFEVCRGRDGYWHPWGQ